MTVEARKKGKKAEGRVEDLALRLGSSVLRDPESDYAGKTDMTIDGFPVQVSCSRKSNRVQRALRKKGISRLVAGEDVTDEQIIEELARLGGR